MSDTLKPIIIDGRQIEVPADHTLFQAARDAGIEIPHFCFHERLSIAGNCRMCLVELKGAPKPVASCAFAVKDCRPGPNGEPPEVITTSPSVQRAREGVMEFLLINHPLDCPICDQGGECDLQDQAMAYGLDTSRFDENKRAVEDKYIGPLVKTIMNRCIHCTRCVRFSTEVAGVSELGATGRGEDMEITTYLEQAMTSELQGNVIDLCPVGALTSRPYAFKARPWELTKTEAIDVMDALGSAIRVDTRGREVMRILPRLNDSINEEWLSDKGRFVFDGLKTQRLDQPYVRQGSRLQPATWQEAFEAIAIRAEGLPGDRIGAIAGDLCAVEEMFALQSLMELLESPNIDCRQDGAKHDPSLGRASYLFNPTIEALDRADAILIVGANPRHEAPLLNARILKAWRWNDASVGLIGEAVDLTYDYSHLGAGPTSLDSLGADAFGDRLRNAERPVIVLGQGALAREDGAAVLARTIALANEFGALRDDWTGFGVLHNAAGRVGGLDIGFVPRQGGRDARHMAGATDLLFLLGADEIDAVDIDGPFTVYIGSHGDRGAHRADVILPGAAYTEKSGLFVNTEGRVQMSNRAAFPPGDAREDWAIVRALSERMGKRLPFDSLRELRVRLFEAYPHLSQLNTVAAGTIERDRLGQLDGTLRDEPFRNPIADYYLTNPIARASNTMAECSALLSRMRDTREAAE